jgi:hypothetical protein
MRLVEESRVEKSKTRKLLDPRLSTAHNAIFELFLFLDFSTPRLLD